jgi:SAM-dependent methyltransferase
LPGELPLNDQVEEVDLGAKYDAIAYASKSVALTHPAHLATVAMLFGLEPSPIATCRTLELGCGDGTNLIPMAMTLPEATFIGVDLAHRPIAIARETATDLALANITFLPADLCALPDDVGSFDYIIAHGVYSWVPAPVRDALLALGSRHLSANGVMFVSYNTLPGCHVRRVAWDILRFHTDHVTDPQARIDAARALATLLAEPATASEGANALLRAEFARLLETPDSSIFHDDLAVPNDPVYVREFIAHAERNGLRFLAEASVSTMSGAGLSQRVRQMLATLDERTREQYVDFARFRRFRQTLLCRADSQASHVFSPQRVSGMHVSATTALNRAAAEGRAAGAPPVPSAAHLPETMQALLQRLVDLSPQAMAIDDARAWLQARIRAGSKAPTRTLEELLLEAFISGTVQLHAAPLPLTTTIEERPIASPLARWQAQRGNEFTNLRHEPVRVEDPVARQVLRLLDGSRNRQQLIDALSFTLPASDRSTAASRVDFYLQNFAKLALLRARPSLPHGD